MSDNISVCWFRTDLRVADHAALTASMSAGPTVGVYVVSPSQWAKHDDAPVKVDFWRRALKALHAGLADLNVPLVGLCVQEWADVPQAMLEFCQQIQAHNVFCNRESGVNERQRDRATYRLLQAHGIVMEGFDDATLLKPGTVLTGAGAPYRVFTPFAKACRERLRTAMPVVLPAPRRQPMAPASILSFEPPEMLIDRAGYGDLSVQMRDRLATLWPASADAAYDRLAKFVESGLSAYHDQRDYPAIEGASKLSPYLAAGLLSPRTCFVAAARANQGELDSGVRGALSWMNELLWREFYRHLMQVYPQLSMCKPMRPETDKVAWRQAPDEFDRWAQGRTGVPIIDAAMRQLLATGWMHNRLRMIVAMFLTKNLLIDWRQGEAFFMRHLIDGDFASNNGGWQWSASTGADAAPYFRVFNPLSQSEKFDPDGRFIRHWLPELADLPAREIHDPSPVARRARGYVDMMVDLKATRLRAIEAFKV